jgi:quinol monooxygenase YgiN
MLVVAGYVDVDFSLLDDPYMQMVTMMTQTRKELGCYGYLLVPDPIEDNRVSIYERWESQAHLDAHLQSAHVADFNRDVGPAITAMHLFTYEVTDEKKMGA